MSARLDELFAVNADTQVTDAWFNGLLAVLEGRFGPLEAQRDALAADAQRALDVGLKRLDETLTPALAKLFAVLRSGFLIAHSTTVQTLVVGETPTFVVPIGAERELFVPSPFVTISRASTPDDYAFARTVGYDPAQGTYTCTIVAVRGDPGPHADWVIQDGTGVADAVAAMLAQVQAARDAAAATAVTVAGQAAAVAAVNARFTVSAAAPSGGKDGDIWFKI